MTMKLLLSAVAIVSLLFSGCTSDAPVPVADDSSTAPSSPSPTTEPLARRNPRDECPEGIEGRGLHMVEPYPPKPYFESFNLWRTKTKTGRTGCLTIVAGRQQKHSSEGEDDPTAYYSNGWLFIFGDYHHNKDGIGGREVPLPRPVRVIAFSGDGYTAVLRLQSLADCSTIVYEVRTASFEADTFKSIAPCPARS